MMRRSRIMAVTGVAMVLAGLALVAWSLWDFTTPKRSAVVVEHPSARTGIIQSSRGASEASTQIHPEITSPALPGKVARSRQPSTRAAAKAAALAAAKATGVRVSTDFEGAYPMLIEPVAADQYEINLGARAVNWWGMKVTGAAGQTLKFRFKGVPAQSWSAMRPLIAYASDLSATSLYEPDANGQSRWQYIAGLTVEDVKTVSFSQKFEQDAAFVVLRVPYTLSYQENYLGSIPKQKGVEVIEIGKSAKGNPLTLIKISAGNEQAERKNPCILMYAREHCDEPDSSWAVQGALQFLTENSPAAAELRQHFEFLLIPILDPDGASLGVHEGIIRSFSVYPSLESASYARVLRNLVNSGTRLDIAIDFHNPEPNNYPNVLSPYMDDTDPTRNYDDLLYSEMSLHLSAAGFRVGKWDKRSPSPGRLMQWAHDHFGALPVIYEINSQAPENRLSLDQTRNLGGRVLQASCSFLASEDGSKLLAETDAVRASRLHALASVNWTDLNEASPFIAEDIVAKIRSKGAGGR